jgi:hypothetical protein
MADANTGMSDRHSLSHRCTYVWVTLAQTMHSTETMYNWHDIQTLLLFSSAYFTTWSLINYIITRSSGKNLWLHLSFKYVNIQRRQSVHKTKWVLKDLTVVQCQYESCLSAVPPCWCGMYFRRFRDCHCLRNTSNAANIYGVINIKQDPQFETIII